MKISRNDKCPCGSGKKIKNCCIDKTETKSFDIQTAIDMLKIGLSNYSKVVKDTKDWHIKDIKYLNGQTLLIEYYTENKNPIDIKKEMCEIMSFAVSFVSNKQNEARLFSEIPKMYGVNAFNKSDERLLYVISSAEIAQKIADGNSIEWLKNSYFEDTTSEFILKNAKIKISTIEKALRSLIYKILTDKYGDNWVDKINNTDYQKMYTMYKRDTGDTSRSACDILDYSFLPNLKGIILDNFSDFQLFFLDRIEFENKMNKLNKIRRDESHNREISNSTYKELETLYDNILQNVAKIDDSIVPKYAIDNWHLQLSRIINDLQRSIPQLDDNDKGDITKIFKSFKKYKRAIELAVIDLSNVLVPLSKKELHNKLLELFKNLSGIVSHMLNCGENLEIAKMQDYFNQYQDIMKQIGEYSKLYILSEG